MDLLIYSEAKSSRLSYIFNHIFNYVLGLDIEITDNVELFVQSQSPKINYSKCQT